MDHILQVALLIVGLLQFDLGITDLLGRLRRDWVENSSIHRMYNNNSCQSPHQYI